MKALLLSLAFGILLSLTPRVWAQDSNGISLTGPYSNTRHQKLSSQQPRVNRQPFRLKDGSKNSGTIKPKNRPFSLVPTPQPTPAQIHLLNPVTPLPSAHPTEILDKNGKPVTLWPRRPKINYPTLYQSPGN